MAIGLGVGPAFKKGFSWSSYWATQLAENVAAQYYWWNNAAFGNTRRIRILHALAGGTKGIDYLITTNTDAHYEISNIYLVDLVNKKLGDVKPPYLDWTKTVNTYMDRVQFTGTSIKYRVNVGTDRGIFRAIRFNGTFRGSLHTATIASVDGDKAPGYYYICRTAANYSALAANLTAVGVRDIVYYNGSTWEQYTEAQYTYIDVDCYAAEAAVEYKTLFSDLPLGTYNIGITGINQKNASSSSVLVFPGTSTQILNMVFSIYGGTPNAGENPVTLMNGAAHWEMSMSIKKNGSAQTAGWIPEHSSTSGTQLNYHDGEDVAYDANGTAIEGYNAGDQGAVACPTFTVTNISYAVNVGAGTEELLKVTTVMTFTKSGINIKNTYEGLIETLATTIYSYMMPYAVAFFNKWVSDYKQELSLPSTGNQTNVTDGAARKDLLLYNDTAEGDYENYALSLSIPNPATTNRSSALTSFLSTYDAAFGKFYLLAAQNKVFSVGESYTTEINVLAGSIAGLIAKVDTYMGS